METKIQLNPNKILNKQFQVDFKGYSAAEVDYFLDIVINDYETFKNLLNLAYERIETLNAKNVQLKEQIKSLEQEIAMNRNQLSLAEGQTVNNVDLLKRISALEKEVFKNR